MVNSQPHPDAEFIMINCAVVTVSDTRTTETDRSGQLIQKMLKTNGHKVINYAIIEDEPKRILEQLAFLGG